jgi:glycosyltransferase involved in cell wall biosynthesis
MYMGLPVVVSDIDTLMEVVENRQTGITVRQKSPEAISEGISYILKHPSHAREMGRNASEFVKTNCSMDIMAEKILKETEVSYGTRGER